MYKRRDLEKDINLELAIPSPLLAIRHFSCSVLIGSVRTQSHHLVRVSNTYIIPRLAPPGPPFGRGVIRVAAASQVKPYTERSQNTPAWWRDLKTLQPQRL
jgi:hypothetical protein